MEYLFLCSMGLNRSPTAAAVCANIAREKNLEIITSYAGIDSISEFTPEIRDKFSGIDKFFVMEPYMQDKLTSWGIDRRKIVCLNIEDMYKKLDPTLVRILENGIRAHIAFELGK